MCVCVCVRVSKAAHLEEVLLAEQALPAESEQQVADVGAVVLRLLQRLRQQLPADRLHGNTLQTLDGRDGRGDIT